jgi:hypothetical protein
MKDRLFIEITEEAEWRSHAPSSMDASGMKGWPVPGTKQVGASTDHSLPADSGRGCNISGPWAVGFKLSNESEERAAGGHDIISRILSRLVWFRIIYTTTDLLVSLFSAIISFTYLPPGRLEAKSGHWA